MVVKKIRQNEASLFMKNMNKNHQKNLQKKWLISDDVKNASNLSGKQAQFHWIVYFEFLTNWCNNIRLQTFHIAHNVAYI